MGRINSFIGSLLAFLITVDVIQSTFWKVKMYAYQHFGKIKCGLHQHFGIIMALIDSF